MRNLKRALSLALASVMLLGMMVVGTSAASYPDVDENDNVEAIEVLNAVKVMIGDRGNFKPDAAVNRHEMAVIMAKLVLGNDTADNYVGTHPFTDVASWADKYVAACYENGIVYGTSKTTFGGDKPLTAVEAAAFMLRALGYKDLSKGASDWSVPVTAMANQIRLFAGVASNPKEQLTRNQVAQLALNTLKSPVVDLKDGTFDVTSGDGAVIISGGSREYIVRSSNESYARAINRTEYQGTSASSVGGYTIELGEHLYNGKLRLEDTTDVFGRPARQWEYDGKEIGAYAKDELLRKEYTSKVTGKDLYDLLSKTTIDEYDFTITIDGETSSSVLGDAFFTQGNLVRTNTKAVGATEKGVLTQVFVDANNKDVYISIINTYLAIADSDYNEKKEEASFNIYHINSISGNKVLVKAASSNATRTVKNEDIDVSGVKKDDIVLVRVAENEIQELYTPEILSDKTINSFKLNSWVKTDGTQYDEADTAMYDVKVLNKYSNNNLKETTYNIILDMYGYMIGIEQNEDPDKYVFITGNDGGSSDLRDKEIDLAAIFLDGTMDVIKVDNKKSTGLETGAIVNKWYTYTKNSSDVYTLTAVGYKYDGSNDGQWAQNVADGGIYVNGSGSPSTTYTIDKAHVALVASSDGTAADRRVYGNDDTVYLNVSTSVITTKTGYASGGGNINASGVATGNGLGASDFKGYTTATTAVNRAVIIDDVDSVVTGVKEANLLAADVTAGKYKNGVTPYTAADLVVPKSEIYTLYGDDGYVIAAVVIGEDQGSNNQYAYVHSSNVKFEEYGHSGSSKAVEGKWSWEREVIINGEIVTLTEVSDDSWSWIDDVRMKQGHWYKVSLDADGQVRKTEDYSQFPTNRYTDDVDKVETYYDANQDLVILEVNYTGGANGLDATTKGHLKGGLTFENGTLYTDYANRKGFAVSKDVKVVYANAALKKGETEKDCGKFASVDWFDEVEDGMTGYEGVKKALRLIDSRDANAGFCGVLTAVIEDGIATSIIFNDTYGEYVDQGGSFKPSDDGDFDKIINNSGTLEIRYYKTAPTSAEVEAIISDAANGEAVTYSSVLGSATIGSGLNAYKMPVKLIQVFKLSIDGTVVDYVDKNTVAGSAYNVAASTKYVNAGTAVAGTGSADATAVASSSSAGVLDLHTVFATMSKDESLMPAYEIKLDTGITGKVGDVDLYVGTGHYNLVAKNASIDLTLTGKSDSKTYQFSSDVDGKFGTAKVLAVSTDKLEATRVAAKNETISAAETITVTVNGTPVTLDSASTTAGVLADAANVKTADYGKYLVELGADGKPTTTATELATGSATSVTVTAGKSYEFGYYKLAVATNLDASKMAHTTAVWKLDGNTVADPTTAFYAKKGAKLVCTVTTDATGFTAASTTQTLAFNDSAEVEVTTAYTSGTAPTSGESSGTTTLTYTASENYKGGVVTATWTVASANIDDIAVTATAT